MNNVRAVARSVFATIAAAVVCLLLRHALSLAAGYAANTGVHLLGLNSYESQISQHIVKAADITERLCSIGGLSQIKDEIATHVLLPLKYPHIFFTTEKLLSPSRGILLHGPPGTGKTMIARAIAAEAGVPFISLTLADLENKYFGESSKLLAATFSLARRIQPCIVFFDEIDGMIRKRSDTDQSCVYSFKTELLAHIDGIGARATDSVVVIGCTNTQASLDPAIRRRLPCAYEIGHPSTEELEEILRLHLASTPNDLGAASIRSIAQEVVPTCSGSDAVEAIRRASVSRVHALLKSTHFLSKLQHASSAAEVAGDIPSLTATQLRNAFSQMGLLDEEEAAPE